MTVVSNSSYSSDFRAEVLASPAYQERTAALFQLYQISRQSHKDPQSLLAIQAALAKLLMEWQERQREFKKEENLLGVAIIRRLLLILQRIADSLVWRTLGYDRLLIQLLAEHPRTGFLDDTVTMDFEAARQISEKEKALVLINDLTTTLRYGDLTVIYPGEPRIEIIENKSGEGSRRSGRANRQKKKLDDLIDFFNTGFRISQEDTQDYIVRADIPIHTYHSVVEEIINQAKQVGYCRGIVSECFAVEAISLEHPNAHLPRERPFESVKYRVSTSNLDLGIFEKSATRIVPYGVFPFDDRICFDLIAGNIQLRTTLNFEALIEFFVRLGLTLEIPQPTEQEVKTYLTASIVERKKTQKKERLSWFVIRRGKNFHRFSPDNWGRMLLELMCEDTFAGTYRNLIDQLQNWEIPPDKITRIYVGYKNENDIWV